MVHIPRRARVSPVIFAFLAAGCAAADTKSADTAVATTTAAAPADPAARANTVNFTARDFAFEGPDSIPAGLTAFHLTNAGKELHHIQLVKLDQGKTFADIQANVNAGGGRQPWTIPYGGVNPPEPGESTTAMQVLEPGNYAIICAVEGADHIRHFTKGMLKGLTVTASPNANMTEPTADVTLTLSDFAFTLSKPLVAGKQMIKVENAAAQSHEVLLVQLQPGKTIGDLAKWALDKQGPSPGRSIGGIPGFRKGQITYFEATLEPGDYAMICFVRDAKDGKPHFAHGMAQQFKIS